MKQAIHKRELAFSGDRDYGRRVRELWEPGAEEKNKNEPRVMSKEESGIMSAWRIAWRQV